MAKTKAAIKEIRVARARSERNKASRSETKSVARRAAELMTGEDKDATMKGFHAAERTFDRAAGKGIMHPNASARRKSRLAKKLNKASAPKTA